jgi:hypothetical protein
MIQEIKEGVERIIRENYFLLERVVKLTQENYNLRTELESLRSREIERQKKELERQLIKLIEDEANAARRIEGCNQ